MKFVIFTPGLRASAIGRMTALVARELVDTGHQVIIVRSEEAPLLERLPHDFGTISTDWTRREIVEEYLQDADGVVYQIGDNYPFHHGCLEWMDAYPGIVCLHDFYLGHLFYGWSQGRHDEARGILLDLYGDGGDTKFFNASAKSSFIEETVADMPLVEWVSRKALGVVTHSAGSIQKILTSCAGPVVVTPLAYDASTIAGRHEVGAPRVDLIEVLTVGHINPNKRVQSVIEAIGSSKILRDRVLYRLVGPVEPHIFFELSAAARRYGVRLRILGEVDDIALAHAFNSADVVCCLRWPSLEAASASAIEAMLHAKAVIVTKTGFYRDIPTSAVIHVDPENEVIELRDALERLTAEPAIATSMGAVAREWAKHTFTASSYAESLLEIATLVSRTGPLHQAIQAFERHLRGWGSSESMYALEGSLAALAWRGE
ncbi:glycosyltransferase [Pinirhizobacter sp.]|uniref:glycosyltransferase n=1 Tax=Pinirhizobacter sp. TaxID=2950432 RepID=UPI002F402EF8